MTGTRPRRPTPLALAALLALSFAAPAHAFTLSARGAYGLGTGAAHADFERSVFPILGGEVTFGFGELLQLGAFYDRFALEPGNGAASRSHAQFYGAVGRLGFGPVSDLFVDARLGSARVRGTADSDGTFGFGAGLGYDWSVGPLLSFRPRMGYNLLPVRTGQASVTRGVLELGLLVSLSLL